ncbi:MAG: aminotransferase class V-fold PLP-dependent enzyme [Planctomycetota bacterium]|jgi:isopenicillin-N epimerase
MPGQPSSPPSTPPEALGTDLGSLWGLDPDVVFLNHGSFGATPRAVLETQTGWRRQLEANPVEFLDRRLKARLDEARGIVGRFVGAGPADLGFVTNATNGGNAVLRSLRFAPGDELVTTDHVYNAIRQTMRHVARRADARVIEVEIPLPIGSADDVVEPLVAALTDRTRLVVIDHVTSPTAVVFPVGRIVGLCAERGIDVLIDGAHAPGMLELDLERLGAAYFTGNLHKWVCGPKGAAFLRVRPDRQPGIHPNTISHFLDDGLPAEFDWQGTRDVTAWLCAADVIDYMERTLGWDRIRRHNHELAVWVQTLLCERWGVEPGTPFDGSLLGSMVTVALPPQAPQRFETTEALQARLYEKHRIEIPVIEWDRKWWIRASAQVYNTPDQYELLADAVTELTAC